MDDKREIARMKRLIARLVYGIERLHNEVLEALEASREAEDAVIPAARVAVQLAELLEVREEMDLPPSQRS